MAKGKDKGSKVKKEKSKSKTVISQTALTESSPAESPTEPEVPPDIRTLKIKITGYKQIPQMFPLTDISIEVFFCNVSIGKSDKVPVTDQEIIPAEHEFNVSFNLNSVQEVDDLISNPLVFEATLTYGISDASVYTNIGEESFKLAAGDYGMSIESAANLFEAFTEKKVEVETLELPKEEPVKQKGKPAKGKASPSKKKSISKSSLGSTLASKSEETVLTKQDLRNAGPVMLGVGSLDLFQMFLGQQCTVECVPLFPVYNYRDQYMTPAKMLPSVVVGIDLEAPWTFMDSKLTNILYFTVESMYNIPNVMTPDMEYRTCIYLPCVTSKLEPLCYSDGRYKTETDIHYFTYWPNLRKTEDQQSATGYRLDPSTIAIRNFAGVELDEFIYQAKPRIEWNFIRRRYLAEDGCAAFYKQLRKYRHIPVEILICMPVEQTSQEGVDPKKEISKPPQTDYLHLMALIDITSLLYPGVSKVRVACPLRTFQEHEMREKTGFADSYFFPKKEEPKEADNVKAKGGKAGKSSSKGSAKGGKAGKGSSGKGSAKGEKAGKKGSSKGSGKGSKGGKKGAEPKEGNDLKELLPGPPPPPPEPSIQVLNDSGEPAFIVVEIELFRPYAPRRQLEDLTLELQKFIPEKPSLPKAVVTSHLAEQYYKETIRRLTDDLNQQYEEYLDTLGKCGCICPCSGDNPKEKINFLTYLQRTGVYQTYMSSLTKATSVIVNDKYSFDGSSDRSQAEYQSLVAEIYVDLVSQMHTVLNEIVNYGLGPKPVGTLAALDHLLLYAKEACEMNADSLAERYYIERVTRDENNADYWFDYAVFCMEIKDVEKAFECVRQALAGNAKHRYGLLMCGLLLSLKEHYEEAETCFLSVMAEYPRWSDGWGVLLLFYKSRKLYEGEQMCCEMAKRYLNDSSREKDYFMDTDDLAWSSSICPNDIYTRAAVLLIKLRCFEYVDTALSYCALQVNTTVDYLIAVTYYYNQKYDSALYHLTQTEAAQGLDYATAALKGHCLLALGDIQTAKQMYMHVLESYNRPEDVHMVYVNISVVLEALNETQEARKMLLLACKHSPTPYTWLAAGLMYFKQNDPLSAEACMVESNLCDNRLAETWAYLTLVNVQLGRYVEASLCYGQAIKNKLNDPDLLKKINKCAKFWAT